MSKKSDQVLLELTNFLQLFDVDDKYHEQNVVKNLTGMMPEQFKISSRENIMKIND